MSDNVLQYLVAIGVPLMLLVLGAFAKKLVRKSRMERKDWFLGVELTLAALGSGLLYLLELGRLAFSSKGNPPPGEWGMAAGFMCVCLGAFVVLLALHQDWETGTARMAAQLWRLAIFANAIGAGLFFAFALFVKGV